MTEATVRDAPERSRFEIYQDDQVAGFAEYEDSDGVRTIPHTEVSPQFRGHGLSSTLIAATLDATRGAGLKVVPHCPAVQAFLDKNPNYADLVVPDDSAD